MAGKTKNISQIKQLLPYLEDEMGKSRKTREETEGRVPVSWGIGAGY